MSDILKQIEEAVYEGEDEIIEELAQKALDEGIAPADIIQYGGVAALERLGDDFNELIVFLPQLMIAGDTMKALISKLNPYMGEASAYKGKVVIGCAKGDLHDIGKSLVATQLSVNGFEVTDIGVDVSNNKFIERAEAVGADIIAVSSLLTTSQYYMEELIKRLEDDGLVRHVFFDGSVTDARGFIAFAGEPGRAFYAVYADGDPAALFWLDGRAGCSARIHFAVLRDYFGSPARIIGFYVTDWLLHVAGADGRPLIEVLVGVPPRTNAAALRLIRDLGFTVLGAIPHGAPLAGGRSVGAVVSYLTRNKEE
jgi:methanogenic corrinoid protein MtbC1